MSGSASAKAAWATTPAFPKRIIMRDGTSYEAGGETVYKLNDAISRRDTSRIALNSFRSVEEMNEYALWLPKTSKFQLTDLLHMYRDYSASACLNPIDLGRALKLLPRADAAYLAWHWKIKEPFMFAACGADRFYPMR